MSSEILNVSIPRWTNSSVEIACGIANAGGGSLFVASGANGADADNDVLKMRRPFEQIPEMIERELHLVCTTTPIMQDGTLNLQIEIPASDIPLSYNGAYWYYTKGVNEKLTREEILRAWSEDASAAWEQRGLPLVEHDDISDMMISMMRNMPLKNIENKDGLIDTVESRLQALNLIQKRTHKLDNAGAIIMCKNPARFIPGATVRITAYDESGYETDEQIDVMGPLPHQIKETVRLIYEKYLPAISSDEDFTKKLPPQDAVREAVTNALVHKNYESGEPVHISVANDKLCIENIGRMPEEWSLEGVVGQRDRRPRNPVLAECAHALDLMSARGFGVENMREACREAKVDPPRIALTSNETLVIFELPLAKGDAGAASQQDQHGTGTPLDSFASRSSAESTHHAQPSRSSAGRPSALDHIGGAPLQRKFNDHSIAAANRLDMTNTDEYVLRVLATNGRATAVRIAEVLGVSERTVRRSFKKLRDYEFVERIGSDKSGYWRIIE